MHILFLSHYFPPEVNAPATRTYEHCRRWVLAGHQVTVVTCAPNCPDGVVFEGYHNSWRSEENVEGIRVIRVWTYLAANKGFFGRILNYLSFMLTATWCALWVPKVNVIVATTPQFFCGWAGVFCRWLRRWPFVLEVRDIWPESIVTVGAMRRSAMIRILEWLERRMYAAAGRIVTVGSGYRQKLLDRGVAAERISVISNGVDISQFKPRATSERLRRKWNATDKFVCAYVGTVGMAHGLDVVLDAAAQLSTRSSDNALDLPTHCPANVLFWIVGGGSDLKRLQTKAAHRRLSNVVFTGMVSKSDIPDVIASCDVCLVHLRKTKLFSTVIPSKIFEMMAMKVPIIMGVRGLASKMVRDAAAGVAMNPQDAQSLLECIANVAANKQAFTDGRKYVGRHFNRDDLAAKMLDVLCNQADASHDPDQPKVPADVLDQRTPVVTRKAA